MERLRYWLYRTLFGALAWLPLRVLYLLSDFLYLILYKLTGYRGKVVKANIASAFPEKTEEERLDIERKFYRQLCDNIVETVKLMHISGARLKKHISVTNPEVVQQMGEEGKSIILYVGHLGNWEWMPAITLFFTRPKVTMEVYKPQSDKAFDELMKRIRERFGARLVKQKSALKEILGAYRDSHSVIVGFLADHRSNSPDEKFHLQFFHHNTPVTTGAEKIGERMKAEFVYMQVLKKGRGQYEFTFVPMRDIDRKSEFPYTQAYYRLLEENIKRQPWLWLWSHRRWLY